MVARRKAAVAVEEGVEALGGGAHLRRLRRTAALRELVALYIAAKRNSAAIPNRDF